MQAIQIRRLTPDDSLDELTSMLHRAFADLGRMGLNCTCVDQSAETTAQRVRLGACYVAVCDSRLVGTATLHVPDGDSECDWYRRPDVASVHQLAVDPGFQGAGCGKGLLLVATHWALERRYRELALNTPAPAAQLIRFYRAQGFGVVEQVQLPGKTYRSTVLSKAIAPALTTRWPGHYAQAPRQAGLWADAMRR